MSHPVLQAFKAFSIDLLFNLAVPAIPKILLNFLFFLDNFNVHLLACSIVGVFGSGAVCGSFELSSVDSFL